MSSCILASHEVYVRSRKPTRPGERAATLCGTKNHLESPEKLMGYNYNVLNVIKIVHLLTKELSLVISVSNTHFRPNIKGQCYSWSDMGRSRLRLQKAGFFRVNASAS